MQLSVMTFNIHHARGIDGRLSLERIASIIKESKADIIGLNEVDRTFSRRSKYMDQLAWLAKEVNMHYSFGPAISLKASRQITRREYGNGLLSRHPIVYDQNHPFTPIPGVKEGRALLEVDLLTITQQRLKVFVTHLSLDTLMRKREIEVIITKTRSVQGPVLLMGDFNMKPGSLEWATLTSSLTDVSQAHSDNQLHMLPTFPSFYPRTQLDYIFTNDYFQVEQVDVFHHLSLASDHLPLQAILTLRQANEGSS